MNAIRVALTLGAVILCAASAATSYEDATRATYLTPGRYLIEVNGNRHTGTSDVARYENLKASELCPNGYVIEQQAGGVRSTGAVAYNCGFGNVCASDRTVADAAIVVTCTHR